ncbi:hypothetical protein EYC84_006982 [Monilinia fructicola]|uniref:Uncharacterized protein n=1 Tax=Monilinia fructicola TaxID=38448 RepID=A0A5M9KA26_MONFR|nr:hypothetical protein EYC84_006982 [Monilinia fructicola]
MDFFFMITRMDRSILHTLLHRRFGYHLHIYIYFIYLGGDILFTTLTERDDTIFLLFSFSFYFFYSKILYNLISYHMYGNMDGVNGGQDKSRDVSFFLLLCIIRGIRMHQGEFLFRSFFLAGRIWGANVLWWIPEGGKRRWSHQGITAFRTAGAWMGSKVIVSLRKRRSESENEEHWSLELNFILHYLILSDYHSVLS